MKTIIGLALVVGGISAGVYCGVWWAFIGGIINVIEAVRAEDLIASDVAIGVAKVIFAGLISWLSAAVLLIPGLALLQSK